MDRATGELSQLPVIGFQRLRQLDEMSLGTGQAERRPPGMDGSTNEKNRNGREEERKVGTAEGKCFIHKERKEK